MSDFSNYKKFENVGIRSSNDTLIVMDSSNNNISLHSSDGGDDNVDTLSIKNIINKTPNMDLNLSSLNGTTINPVITINNNNQDCRINTNLNVNGNINLTNGGILKTTGIGSFGSINCGVGSFTSIDSGSGSFGTVTANTFSGTLSGNAATATKLATTRSIGGVSFDGGADIYLPGVNTSGNQNTSGNAATATAASNVHITDYGSTGSTHYIPFAAGYGGTTYNLRGNSDLYYTPSSNTLYATAWKAIHSTAGYSLVDTHTSQELQNKKFNGTCIFFHTKRQISSFTHSGYSYKSQNNISEIKNNEYLWGYDAAQFSNHSASQQYSDVDIHVSWYTTSHISAKFDYGIYVGDGLVLVACDKRNKHLINEINDAKALEIIRKINVYTFYFKDKFGKPLPLQYDVLAQEVQEHFPSATFSDIDYLSNIVQKVEVKYINTEDNKFKMILETPIEEIKTNKNVRFYCYMKENTKKNIFDTLDLKCIENNNTFIIEKKYDYIICIGTEEDDVLAVNKQVIYSLCHSAIQELDRQQIADKERITNLETENQQQQTKINELTSIIDKLKTANSFEEFKQTF